MNLGGPVGFNVSTKDSKKKVIYESPITVILVVSPGVPTFEKTPSRLPFLWTKCDKVPFWVPSQWIKRHEVVFRVLFQGAKGYKMPF